MRVVPSPILLLAFAVILLLVASEASDMVLSAVKECEPNKSEFQMASRSRTSTSSTTGSCGSRSHCVLNGNSSLGGYCIDNDHKATASDMEMPEALRKLCFVCDSDDGGSTSVVTKPDQLVGSFTCGELEGLGHEGKIPSTNCLLFQHMIRANELCGCSVSVSAASSSLSTEPDDADADADVLISSGDHDERNGNDNAGRQSSSSSNSLDTIAITSAGASTAIALAIIGVTSVLAILLQLVFG